MVPHARRSYTNRLILLPVDILVIFGVFRLVCYVQRSDWRFEGDYPLFFAVFALLWWIMASQFANPKPGDRLTTYAEKFWSVVRTLLLDTVLLTAGIAVLQLRLMPIRYLVLLYAPTRLG